MGICFDSLLVFGWIFSWETLCEKFGRPICNTCLGKRERSGCTCDCFGECSDSIREKLAGYGLDIEDSRSSPADPGMEENYYVIGKIGGKGDAIDVPGADRGKWGYTFPNYSSSIYPTPPVLSIKDIHITDGMKRFMNDYNLPEPVILSTAHVW